MCVWMRASVSGHEQDLLPFVFSELIGFSFSASRFLETTQVCQPNKHSQDLRAVVAAKIEPPLKKELSPQRRKRSGMTKVTTVGFLLVAGLFLASVAADDVSYDCDYSNDSCSYKEDGECDAPFILGCPEGTDCFDCDPKNLKFSLTSCEECTENDGIWCGKDALCLSAVPNLEGLTKELTCSGDEFVTDSGSCGVDSTNLFSNSLYDSMSWVYDLINVEPVWREGITGTFFVVTKAKPKHDFIQTNCLHLLFLRGQVLVSAFVLTTMVSTPLTPISTPSSTRHHPVRSTRL